MPTGTLGKRAGQARARKQDEVVREVDAVRPDRQAIDDAAFATGKGAAVRDARQGEGHGQGDQRQPRAEPFLARPPGDGEEASKGGEHEHCATDWQRPTRRGR